MFHGADRIAHVVQAIEEANEVIVLYRVGLCGVDVELHAIVQPRILCRLTRGLDRAGVIFESKETRVGKCLRHQPRGDAVTAADVRDLGAALARRSSLHLRHQASFR
jgi:hypothetical protein